MSQDSHKSCYGTLFPSVLCLEADQVVSGKVFSYEQRRAGGFLVSQRRVAANQVAWDECRLCPEFTDCYQLSLGKLSLEAAIR